MRKVLKTLALVAIGVAVGRVSKSNSENSKLSTKIKIADLEEYKSLLKELNS